MASYLTNGETKRDETAAERNTASLEVFSSIRCDHLLTRSPHNTQLSYHDCNAPSQFYMLRFHRDRMLAAVDELGWIEARGFLEGPSGVVRLNQVLQDHLVNSHNSAQVSQPLKLRIAVNSRGHTSVTSISLPSLPLSSLLFSHFPPTLSRLPPSIDHPNSDRSWRVFISPTPVSPSLFTRHKTTERAVYDEARSHIPTTPQSDLPDNVLSEILVANHRGEVMEGSITTPYFWRRGRWVTPPASAGGNTGTTRRFALEAGSCVEETVMRQSVAEGEAIWLSNGARGWGWGEIEKLDGQGSDGSISSSPIRHG
ncbi:Aminodeoxychorismate lyase [Xanthoria parietina]